MFVIKQIQHWKDTKGNPVIQCLLTEFNDVLTTGLPPGLPPKRAIDHKINILWGSTPPAKALYKLFATQFAELKKQLIELETSGLSTRAVHHTRHPLYLLQKRIPNNANVHGLSSTQQDNNQR